DGIRDRNVTGVQTCALPIFWDRGCRSVSVALSLTGPGQEVACFDGRRGNVRPVSDIKRSEKPFEVISDMTPAGDQPEAIAEITRRVRAGNEHTVLLGATGTGKTATVAWTVEQLQRPTLVMQPNKTLAAQF